MVTSSVARARSGQNTGQILQSPTPTHTHRSCLVLQQCGEWDSLGEHRCLLKGHLEPSSLSTAFQGKALGLSHSLCDPNFVHRNLTLESCTVTPQSATKYFLVGINILPSNLKCIGHHWQLLTHPTIFKVRAAYFRSLTESSVCVKPARGDRILLQLPEDRLCRRLPTVST